MDSGAGLRRDIEAVRIWKASDGKVFTSKDEAKSYQGFINLRDALDDAGIGKGGSWSPESIARALWTEREAVKNIILKFSPPLSRPIRPKV